MSNEVIAPTARPILEAEKVSKSYGRIQALSDVDFTIHAGEVVGLVGDNGAGKSTLIKILSGAIAPDQGTMRLKGEAVRFKVPSDARKRGIETVYQDLSLAPHLTIADNLFLGREVMRTGAARLLGVLDRPAMVQRAQQILDELHVTVRSMKALIGELSGGQRQAVAVARAVLWGDSMIILDEPTNHLGVEEVDMVLNLIRRVKERGIPVVYISHTLPHVLEVTDRIDVMFLGRLVKSLTTADTNLDEVIAYITGSRNA